MRIRLFVLPAVLAGAIACNQAPAGQETAPAGSMPGAATGGAPIGTSGPGAPAAPGALRATAGEPAASKRAPAAPAAPMMMEMTVPAGAALEITLETPVASDTSSVEDAVRGRVAKAVDVGGMTTIPAGSVVTGTVVAAHPSARVKGLASIAIRFNRVVVADTPYSIHTAQIAREAQATKGNDAKKIGVGAGAGAVIGAIAGGGKGAAIGTAVGAGAGTGVVMATKGKEVSIGAGTNVRTTFSEPVKINAPM